MEGPMEGLEPDVTENEVSTLSRNLFKLEKAFENNPNAMKICNKVCIQKEIVICKIYYTSIRKYY